MRPEHSTLDTSTKKPMGARARRNVRQFLRMVFVRFFYYSQMIRLARHMAHKFSLGSPSASTKLRLQRHPESKFAILCYHRVGTAGAPFYSRLPERAFAAQMKYLRRNYRVVPLSQLCCELHEGHRVPPTVAVTFDDGYRDLYRFAFPILQEYSIPATVYLIGHCIESGEAPWYDRIFAILQSAPLHFEAELSSHRLFRLRSPEDRLAAAWEIIKFLKSIPDTDRRTLCAQFRARFPVDEAILSGRMLDWEQVREMYRNGIRFGAHTMTHPAVSQLHPSQMPEELLNSKRLLENGLDAPIKHFAYPFGKPEDFNGLAQEFLARSGFRSAVTTVEGFNSRGANAFELRRVQIGDGPSLPGFSFELCRVFLAGHPEKDGPAILDERPADSSPQPLRECLEPMGQKNA